MNYSLRGEPLGRQLRMEQSCILSAYMLADMGSMVDVFGRVLDLCLPRSNCTLPASLVLVDFIWVRPPIKDNKHIPTANGTEVVQQASEVRECWDEVVAEEVGCVIVRKLPQSAGSIDDNETAIGGEAALVEGVFGRLAAWEMREQFLYSHGC